MKKRLSMALRLLTVAFIAVLITIPATPCLAAGIASPDTMTVNTIEAYQSVLETGE